MDRLTAYILAGGRSSRMGSDKALLRFGGETFLERALGLAHEVCAAVKIVGSRQIYGAFGDVVEDRYPGCGPLGGIEAALNSTETDVNLVLSVDIPLMRADFLRWLVAQGSACEEIAVVPDALGGIQPLCAVYRRALGAYAERALQEGEYKIGRMLERVPVRYVDENEIRAAGFSPEIFRNVNTKEEFVKALQDAGMASEMEPIR